MKTLGETKAHWLDAAMIATLALAVRLIYVFQLSHTVFFDHPVVDAQYHDAWAREILRLGIGHEGIFFRAPLYPYFLALVYALSDGSFLWARWAQAALGGLTAGMTYLLAWELTRRRRIACAAGIGAALYGILVYFDGELLVETLLTPLLLSSLWAYAKYRRSRQPLHIALSGFFLGMAAITRPSVLVIAPLLCADLIFSDIYTGLPRRFKSTMLAYAALTLGALLPISPVARYNLLKGSDSAIIAASGGINFYIGNNPQADGLHSAMPGLGAVWDVPAGSFRAYQVSGRVLKLTEVNDYYADLGWQFIFDQPLTALELLAKKFFAFWNRLEISNNRDLYFFKGETAIMPVLRLLGFWIVGPLGLAGLWIAWRRKLLPGWFLGIIPVYMLGVIAFFVTARFRAPLIPLLLICASIALFQLMEQRKALFDRRRLADFAILALGAGFVNTNPWHLQKENPAHAYFCLGMAHLDAGDLDSAQWAFQSSISSDLHYPRAHLNLGVIAYRKGDAPTAEKEYQDELSLHPGEFRALNNLGVLRYESGRLSEAAEFYQEALNMAPYFEDARINLAQVRFRFSIAEVEKGNFAAARAQLGEALRLRPDFEAARKLMNELDRASSGESQLSP
jgi:Tfp pilus assembly protein PilF/4-amino-4-deoxy-L-arabinose transferase-like glycosyltransferase